MVQEGGRFGEVWSHTAGGEIVSVLQFRFISFQLTQIAGQHPGIQSIKLSIPAAFCSRTRNKVWGNQTNCWLWAKCSSLTLQTICFSRRKLPTLLRNTVLQWLALKVTPGLRISGYFSWCLNGWLVPGEFSALEALSLRCTEVQEKALWIQNASPHLRTSNALFSLLIFSLITRTVYLTDEKLLGLIPCLTYPKETEI